MPQTYLATNVKGRLGFPLQVGVIVAYGAQRYSGCVIYRHDARLLHIIHGGVGADATQVARLAIAHAQL